MLIDITDRRDALVVALLKTVDSREASEALVTECLDTQGFFEPKTVILDLAETGLTPFAVATVLHLCVTGRFRGFRVAVCGPMPAVKVALDGHRITPHLAGVYGSREEALTA